MKYRAPLKKPSRRTNFKQPCQKQNNQNTTTRQEQDNIDVTTYVL